MIAAVVVFLAFVMSGGLLYGLLDRDVSTWRAFAFAAYCGLVGLVLVGVVVLVAAHKAVAFGVFLAFVALALAWPHRYYLRALVTR